MPFVYNVIICKYRLFDFENQVRSRLPGRLGRGPFGESCIIRQTPATVNRQAVTRDAASFIESSRTYLPFRFAAEIAGTKVDWDGEPKKGIITK